MSIDILIGSGSIPALISRLGGWPSQDLTEVCTAKYVEEVLSNLVELAVEAHGGLKLWREIKEVELKLSLTGVLFQNKGHPAGLPNITMKIATHQQRVSILPYPQPGQIGHFTPRRVGSKTPPATSADNLKIPLAP